MHRLCSFNVYMYKQCLQQIFEIFFSYVFLFFFLVFFFFCFFFAAEKDLYVLRASFLEILRLYGKCLPLELIELNPYLTNGFSIIIMWVSLLSFYF